MSENNQNGGEEVSGEEPQPDESGSSVFEPTATSVPVARDALAEFEAYCRSERERRSQFEDEFEAELFDEAVDRVMHKLRAHLGEGF